MGDGWFSSGTPSFDDARRLRDRLTTLRAELGRRDTFPIFVRVAGLPDAGTLARYETEGFEHVVLWADQVWPSDGDADAKRASLRRYAEQLGIAAG